MDYKFPFILTFLGHASFSYQASSVSFVNKDFIRILQITKLQLGFIYCLSTLMSLITNIFFMAFASKIRKKLITMYAIGLLGLAFSSIMLIIAFGIFERPHKIVLYISSCISGHFRAYYYPLMLSIIKVHKEKHQRIQKIPQQKYKIILYICSIAFDMGAILGFSISGLLEDILKWDWKIVISIASSLPIISSIFIYIFLKEYIEQQQPTQLQISTNNQQKTKKRQAKFTRFFSILNEYFPNKIFLFNSSILDTIHTCLVFVLPPYFFASGFQGSEAFIVSFFHIFFIAGASIYAFVELRLNKVLTSAFIKQDQDNSLVEDNNLGQQNKQKNNKSIFPFTESIFLFLLFTVLMSCFIYSMIVKQQQLKPSFVIQMIFMAFMGLTCAGPMLNFFSYHSIKVMTDLDRRYDRRVKQGQIFTTKQDNEVIKSQNKGMCNCLNELTGIFTTRKYQVSTFLITFNNLVYRFVSIIFYILSFFIIQQYIEYLFGFYAILTILVLIFSFISNLQAFNTNDGNDQAKDK